MNLAGTFYRIGMGLDQAGAALVGQALGTGNDREASHYFNTFTGVAACIIMVEFVLMYLYRIELINIYTDDDEMTKLAGSLIWLLCIQQVPDTFKAAF